MNITNKTQRARRGKLITWAVGAAIAAVAVVGAVPPLRPTRAAALPDPRPLGAEVFDGWALDTCHAPSLATLDAWRDSRYGAVGVYFGGRGRACKSQPRLTVDWMRGAGELGWRVLPLYVGSQSPCVRAKRKKNVRITGDAWTLGRSEGWDAVQRARGLGMRKRSALYLDMEAYDQQNAKCAATTLSFIRGWVRETRSHGYFPGFYSSAGSGVRHLELARRAGLHDLPSVMWFARWHVKGVLSDPVLSPTAWHPHRRIHQYAGNVTERHGGAKMLIDRNRIDAPVAIID